MWRSTSRLGKWLMAIIVTLAVMLVPWWFSLSLMLLSSIWFTEWYQGLLPVLWFDLVYGSPLALPFYPGVVPLSALLVLWLLIVVESKRYFHFRFI